MTAESRKPTAQPAFEAPRIIDLTPEEERELIERDVRELFGITPEKFIRRWHAEEIENPDRADVLRVLFLAQARLTLS